MIGCLGLGLWEREQVLARIRHLGELQEILERWMSEIRFGRAPLPECCQRLGQHLKEPYAHCFLEIYEEMKKNTGENFAQVFQRKMEVCLGDLPLTKEDKALFLSCVDGKHFAEEQMQLVALQKSKEELEHVREELEGQKAQKCRIAVSLGATGGLFLVLILL